MRPVNYDKIYHQIRMECIKIQKEINSTKTLSLHVHQKNGFKNLKKQLAELKKEYLEQELHQRLDQMNS